MSEELTEEMLAEWEHALHEDGAMECEIGRTLQLIAEVRRLRAKVETLEARIDGMYEATEVERLRAACEEVLDAATCYFPRALLDQVEEALGRCPVCHGTRAVWVHDPEGGTGHERERPCHACEPNQNASAQEGDSAASSGTAAGPHALPGGQAGPVSPNSS